MKQMFENGGVAFRKYIITIIFTIALIILVGGVSYAAFSFIGTGTRENVITAGQISILYDEKTTMTITNRYAETDEVGFNNNEVNSTMTFDIKSNTSGSTIINYAIAIDSTSMQQGTTLTEDYIRLALIKDNTEVFKGSTIKSFKGYGVENYIEDYLLTTNSISGTDIHHYTLKAWVGEDYDLPTTNTSSGTTHSNTTTSETYTFKLKVYGTTEELTVTEPSEEPEEGNKVTILSMYQSEDLHIGDFITYDAGTWTAQEIASIQVGPNSSLVSANNSTSKPSTHYQFGGFTTGQSRNVGAVESDTTYIYAKMYDDNDSTNQVALSGWRIFDIDETNGLVTLISAANPEDYYHPYVTNSGYISEYILTGQVNEDMCDPNEYNSDNYTIRDWSMYENSRYNASNARVITKTELDNWYNKYMGVTSANTSTQSTFQRIYSSPYLKYQNLIDNHNFYWLGSAYDDFSLYYVFPSDRHVRDGFGAALGVRVLVSIPLTSTIQENPVARRTVTLDGMEWWDGTYGPESVQEYNVWDLAVE